MSTATSRRAASPTPTEPEGAPARGRPPDVRKGGWFVRITIAVIVALWLIPTVGVLVTSFRPEELVDTTGWWTALGHLFDRASGRSRTTARRSTPAASRTPS